MLTVFAAQASLLVRNALLVNDLKLDNRSLHERIEQMRFGEILGSSPRMQEVFRKVQKVAGTDISVLVTGETGTGKELIARELHNRSPRAKRPFVTINCGAIPENLLESELFGHVRGAFTGAVTNKMGRFQAADGGTLFLDEIGEMPLPLQVKLLRALQERVVVRVGDTNAESIDIRVIAATNRDLETEIKTGRFREDLYYRLNVVHLHLPPLRDRGDDIVVLARYMVGPLRPRVRQQRPRADAQRDRRHQAAPLARQHPRAREPDQEGGGARRQGAAGPRGPRSVGRRPADDPAAGGGQGEVPARLHQRGAGAQRRQPDQDRPRSGRRSAHHLPPPGEGRRHRPRRVRGPKRSQRTSGALMRPAGCRARGTLVFVMLGGWGAGCVIPVGPQFQDPLVAPNLPPKITSTNPPEGIVTGGLTFEIAVTDPNGDGLSVRWIAEYPPYQERRTLILGTDPVSAPTDGPAPTPAPTMTVDCSKLDASSAENTLGRHQIMVVVADRAFSGERLKPDGIVEGGQSDRASWTLNLSCPPTP